jgi:heme-degrading monooxygenase HmoA
VSSLDNVLKVNVYITSVDMFSAVNEVYRRFFPKDPPARIFINVPAWNGGFDIEVDGVAAVQAHPSLAEGTRSSIMFSVIFEVHPKPRQWDAYLGKARALRPELERVDGFVDNIRYKSLTREGWILSLSGWRDEKAVVRWRTSMRHHMVQEKGRSEILLDYHLRVGQITQDTRIPEGYTLQEQRLDETEIGEGTTITLVDATRPPEWVNQAKPDDVAKWLGLAPDAAGLVGWDVFDAVLTPGDVVLLISWKDQAHAEAFDRAALLPDGARFRRVRVVRDYGMFDRREAPQYYPDAKGASTPHS